jgi:excisionase family DNA binding protein
MSSLLTAEQVADRLGVSKQHVYGMMERNQIPHVRIPGRSPDKCSRRVDPDDLARWIAERKTAA